MSVALNCYIGFNGNAREAMEFYQSVFGGEIHLDTFGNYAEHGMPVSDGDTDKIMHGYLKGDTGIEIMSSDTPSGSEFDPGQRITLALSGDDKATLGSYWDKLSAEGEVTMPMQTAPWGDSFGMITDKYGVSWMVNISSANTEAA